MSHSNQKLVGTYVRLEPLSLDHESSLISAARDGELWTRWYTTVPSPEKMKSTIEERLSMSESQGTELFTVFNKNGDTLGMTGFQSLNMRHKRGQIGYTWYRQSVQNTVVNSECKLLLLGRAFDDMNLVSVFFTTNTFNRASRRSLESIGAKCDGILRSHQILDGGLIRDTCVYSILSHEWPAVKQNLQYKITTKNKI